MNYRDVDADNPVLVVTLGRMIFGLAPATGRRIWRYVFTRAGTIRLQITGDRVYAMGGGLVCLNYLTGEVIWEAKIDLRGGVLLLQGGRLYLTGGGEVSCFTVDGRELWRQPFQGYGFGEMALGFPRNVVQADESA